MASLDFDTISNDAQVFSGNTTNDIAMYLSGVSLRRASRHAGTDVTALLTSLPPRRATLRAEPLYLFVVSSFSRPPWMLQAVCQSSLLLFLHIYYLLSSGLRFNCGDKPTKSNSRISYSQLRLVRIGRHGVVGVRNLDCCAARSLRSTYE